MIVMPTALSDEEIERLRRWDIPLVLVNHAARLPGVDTILTMNREGAFQATGHLLAHDYGRVALIAGPADSSEAQEREEGYRQALTQYAIPFDETLVVLGDFRQPGGYAAMNRLLAMPMPPRAVFVANDEMAFGALEAIKGRGLRIPDDIAVIGFDDIPLAAHLRPAPTTVRQPCRTWPAWPWSGCSRASPATAPRRRRSRYWPRWCCAARAAVPRRTTDNDNADNGRRNTTAFQHSPTKPTLRRK